MGKPTEKMVILANKIHSLGLDKGHSEQSFIKALSDFDSCFKYIGLYLGDLRRDSEPKMGTTVNKYSWGPIDDPPIHPDIDWGADTEMMREFYGDESNWRWDGL